jgi:large subunit ribosomal protein L30
VAYLKVTWRRSAIGRNRNQRRVIESLGLKRLSDTAQHRDTPAIRGMINKVSHLVEVELVEEEASDSSSGN